ncbi:potassium channel family protein [Terracoccus sp. 273MFTsu3.1]|uniref:potassium channel family protein n=1 Tax=Terracoccus sp. 273MFTsu3.1 TaxID=1172188 RepID=UPI000372AD72|nr:potassium channel family protein [Terracoccus sp. 273MFTsu3.1]
MTVALFAPPRRAVVVALLRVMLSLVVAVVVYFRIPLTWSSEARSIMIFVSGLVIVVVVLAFQTRSIVRSPYPLLRTVEALATTGPLFLIVFASSHYVIDNIDPGSYTQPMTRLDALYYTVTTFATVGYGDIAPVSETARLAATLQMLLGLVFLGLVARVITGATRLGMRRRREGHES